MPDSITGSHLYFACNPEKIAQMRERIVNFEDFLRGNDKEIIGRTPVCAQPEYPVICGSWECIDGEHNVKHCVDTESINDDGTYRTVQGKMIIPEGAPIEVKNVSYMNFTVSYDCKNKTTAWLSADAYGKDNKIIEGESATQHDPVYGAVQTDNKPAMFLYNRVCGK